jgi:hypothetical protein
VGQDAGCSDLVGLVEKEVALGRDVMGAEGVASDRRGEVEQKERAERGSAYRSAARAGETSGGQTSWLEVLARGDDMLDGDRGMSAGGSVVERLEGEVVGRTQVAAADLEDRVEGAVVERGAGGASDGAAVGDVLGELVARVSRRSWA